MNLVLLKFLMEKMAPKAFDLDTRVYANSVEVASFKSLQKFGERRISVSMYKTFSNSVSKRFSISLNL